MKASGALCEMSLDAVHNARIARHSLGTQRLLERYLDGDCMGSGTAVVPVRGCPSRRRLEQECTCGDA